MGELPGETAVVPTQPAPEGVAIDATADPAPSGPDPETAPDAEVVAAEAAVAERSRRSGHDRTRARALFAELSTLDEDDPARARIREELVEMHLPLVEYLARRFRNRGEPLDDLVQVATIGLIKSVDRFDLERGVEFSTYATPTIVGEVKRHFRDKGWAIRVPRRLQELKLSLAKATGELSQRNGRAPTVAELAAHLEMSEEDVLEGLESANAYSTISLDAPDSGDDESPAVADSLGMTDEALEGVEYRESLKPMLEQLPPREKKILLLRFFGNMTQSQIAAELGISQMHVSRLLARTLASLREGLLTPPLAVSAVPDQHRAGVRVNQRRHRDDRRDEQRDRQSGQGVDLTDADDDREELHHERRRPGPRLAPEQPSADGQDDRGIDHRDRAQQGRGPPVVRVTDKGRHELDDAGDHQPGALGDEHDPRDPQRHRRRRRRGRSGRGPAGWWWAPGGGRSTGHRESA